MRKVWISVRYLGFNYAKMKEVEVDPLAYGLDADCSDAALHEAVRRDRGLIESVRKELAPVVVGDPFEATREEWL